MSYWSANCQEFCENRVLLGAKHSCMILHSHDWGFKCSGRMPLTIQRSQLTMGPREKVQDADVLADSIPGSSGPEFRISDETHELLAANCQEFRGVSTLLGAEVGE